MNSNSTGLWSMDHKLICQNVSVELLMVSKIKRRGSCLCYDIFSQQLKQVALEPYFKLCSMPALPKTSATSAYFGALLQFLYECAKR
jgi:hypothetical protein